MHTVKIEQGAIHIDGHETQLISGSIHYFRVPRALWRDRIARAKAMGLNAVETYVAWQLHESSPGTFDFAGDLDLGHFLDLIAAAGLYAIVRPGPYICAEFDNGGLPVWLNLLPGVRLRCMNPPYCIAVERFFDRLMAEIAPRRAASGGPVVMMQLENEYGSFGCDKHYLRWLERLFREKYGISEVLFTSDGAGDFFLQGGTLDGVLQTLNFGSRAIESFAVGRKYRPEGPDFCMEFWDGWFDHWGNRHGRREAADVARELAAMLASGASVNFYMFHGGTNFGFTGGANFYPDRGFGSTVTSYDYDAPLSECGDITEKYLACQAVIAKYRPGFTPERPADPEKRAYPAAELTEYAPLYAPEVLTRIGDMRETPYPESMEFYGQYHGFVNYRCHLNGPWRGKLVLPEVRDRAILFLDGRKLGSFYRPEGAVTLELETPAGGAQLDVLVEEMGHINYGTRLGCDSKGLPGGVLVDNLQQVMNFAVTPLDLSRLEQLPFRALATEGELSGPAFYRGEFAVDRIADTFLRFPGGKGTVWINGFHLGRYWDIGPGDTLYVPRSILRSGGNAIAIFELEALRSPRPEFTDRPHLG